MARETREKFRVLWMFTEPTLGGSEGIYVVGSGHSCSPLFPKKPPLKIYFSLSRDFEIEI